MTITLNTIVHVLRDLAHECGHGEQPYLELSDTDHRLDRREFSLCTDGGMPGLNRGQSCECRFSLRDGPEGLHMQHHEAVGVLRFHLDEVDPLRDSAGHVAADTNALPGAIFGAIIGGLLTRSAKGAAIGAALGGGAGALSAKNTARYFTLQSLRSGRLEAVAIAKGTAPQYVNEYA